MVNNGVGASAYVYQYLIPYLMIRRNVFFPTTGYYNAHCLYLTAILACSITAVTG